VNVGYYVTVIRGERVGWLRGPFDTEPLARAALPEARRLAERLDYRCAFDLFGTAKVETHRPLPKGVLDL
jgi:hypothetical protein